MLVCKGRCVTSPHDNRFVSILTRAIEKIINFNVISISQKKKKKRKRENDIHLRVFPYQQKVHFVIILIT